jgi:DNA-binding response OmpR family regulator
MEHKGQTLEREKIFNAVWGADCFSELSSLSVYISWLKAKIEDDPKNPTLINTVYKVGYRFGDDR